ncbi:DUF3025 domain-containing protein [Chitinimonas koreensis]|uniref:DUF3025 domain-containing protein n=1 Tax=Chitinimonas koreensis TaxID=356302 RepID=UPI0004148769|nr:DUF3025 domain-containing protein [Chitinimonas koreensis]QNM96114.1 DUF3025 domain-containing protein [Chitinimonas koreensis]
MPDWPQDLLDASPWFAVLRPLWPRLGWQRFPAEADWATLDPALRPHTDGGRPVHFVAADGLPGEGYEARIGRCGEVATRPGNWHDAFNALCWLAWPRSKAALNALHLRELAAQAGPQRSRVRDCATLFDESGLVLAYCGDSPLAALRGHDWDELFLARRGDWGRRLAPLAFGHALLEKGLAPFVGIVARTMLVEVEPGWFDAAPGERLDRLDRAVAAAIADGLLAAPGALSPLPVLGIPGWWPRQDAAFYADRQHFRPRRVVVHQD